ncbi:MAG: hypothetical protein B6245_09305 [Desulfobacteraceae bacterium 4572_88]|nr:MAG: hypothetical protein B6245_09305 [Desulfobacteraceae bacterium 4572_88]
MAEIRIRTSLFGAVLLFVLMTFGNAGAREVPSGQETPGRAADRGHLRPEKLPAAKAAGGGRFPENGETERNLLPCRVYGRIIREKRKSERI